MDISCSVQLSNTSPKLMQTGRNTTIVVDTTKSLDLKTTKKSDFQYANKLTPGQQSVIAASKISTSIEYSDRKKVLPEISMESMKTMKNYHQLSSGQLMKLIEGQRLEIKSLKDEVSDLNSQLSTK